MKRLRRTLHLQRETLRALEARPGAGLGRVFGAASADCSGTAPTCQNTITSPTQVQSGACQNVTADCETVGTCRG